MKTNSEKTVEKLQRYFNVKTIGSYLFVQKGLLTTDDISDIDILVQDDEQVKVIRKFLKDERYKETESPSDDGYGHVSKGSRLFEKEGELQIHLIIDKEVLDLEDVISTKYKRGLKKDLKQIIKICRRKMFKNDIEANAVLKATNPEAKISATEKKISEYDSLKKIVDQLEMCDYENEAGVLNTNVAFLALKRHAQNE